MSMFHVTKRLEIAGSHQLFRHKGKCKNLHGHNWIITVTCSAETLNSDNMVIDFGEIKEKISDALDHKFLNQVLDQVQPTAEYIAKWIADQFPTCTKVTVQESEGNSVCYIR